MENIFDRDTQKLNAALDEALELTFPASDPIAVTPVKETDSAWAVSQSRLPLRRAGLMMPRGKRRARGPRPALAHPVRFARSWRITLP